MSKIRFLGLDVHADTIAVAIAETGGEVRPYGVIPNQLDAIRRMVKKLGPAEELRACYEAGPTGYVLFWQLTALDVDCQVIAPSLAPTKPGDRVKTDRRDAERLARSHRAGELTSVWVEWIKCKVHFEQAALEATLRDYVRQVEHAAERIQLLEKDLAQVILASPIALRAVVEALQALRGVAFITAVSIVAELGILTRFASPRQLMGYSGLVSSEYSSGNRVLRGGITKTGNAHLRRVIVEAAWAYQYRPWVGGYLAKRQKGLDPEIVDMAWKAQHRLHSRYKNLAARGKNKPQMVTAVGRELLGFVWAIAVKTEAKFTEDLTVAA